MTERSQGPARATRERFIDKELGEVVASLTDGWTCPQCRYNLEGQAIHVEPTYRFLVSRCPECGRVWPTQVQELKPSTRRLMVYGSGLIWWGGVVGGVFGTGMFLFGMGASAAEWVSWRNELTSWVALSDLLWFPPVCLLVALTGAIGLPHLRTLRLLLLALGSMAIGTLSLAAYLFHDLRRGPDSAELFAGALHLFVGCVTLGLAVWLARPLARLIGSLFMSTKMARGLSALWTADGITPPWAERA